MNLHLLGEHADYRQGPLENQASGLNASQIPELLARVCFLVLSRSKTTRLPGKRIDFDPENIKKDTPASNP